MCNYNPAGYGNRKGGKQIDTLDRERDESGVILPVPYSQVKVNIHTCRDPGEVKPTLQILRES